MSKLGKSPIALPKNVEIIIDEKQINVKGPKGTLSFPAMKEIAIVVEDGFAKIEFNGLDSLVPKNKESLYWGLYRASLNNMIIGVTTGFKKLLRMEGVGYKASVQGQKLDLQVGFSHPTQLSIPTTLQVTVEKNTEISVTGIDKQIVGQFAAEVRAVRPPEPYKGKGIRYVDEYVRRKDGKKAGKGSTGAGK
jgi:large subunit ribosomal protein L6